MRESRAARADRRAPRAEPVAASSTREPAPAVVAVFRRPDDTLCHARCGRPLTLQGVRGALEVDFYCLTCLAHVTVPVDVLDRVPVGGGSSAH